jgi:signal transduction histidine kinase
MRRSLLSVSAGPLSAGLLDMSAWSRGLAAPLLSGETGQPVAMPVGALCVYATSAENNPAAGSEWDKKVLACLAHYAALAVQNQARQDALRIAQEQRAVAETFAAVGDVAANLLHQLNNKVGTIPVRIEGIQDKCAAALQADLYLTSNLEAIDRSATEAMETVRESLSHLRPITLVPVDVQSCLTAAQIPVGINLSQEGLRNLPSVLGARQSLALVFSNLMENAAAAGANMILIRGSAGDGYVEITVSDDGPGIPPALQDRIFDFNVSGRKGSHTNKLGFGLWWVKTLMARLGGSVSVDPPAGQQGATFRLRLPLALGKTV